jgi:S1-C subfamily serine protease
MRTALILACLLLPAAAALGDEPAETYAKSVDGTVFITAVDRDWNFSHGTGVVISGNFMITAYHVVGQDRLIAARPPLRDRNGEIITDAEPYNNYSQDTQCQVIATDPKRDLALLRFKYPRAGLKTIRLARHAARPGQAIFTIGNDPAVSMWHFAAGNVRQVHQTSYRFKDGQQIAAKIIEMTVPINPGDSGGPLLNASGELVGINSATSTQANEVHHGIDMTEIAAFVDETTDKLSKSIEQAKVSTQQFGK